MTYYDDRLEKEEEEEREEPLCEKAQVIKQLTGCLESCGCFLILVLALCGPAIIRIIIRILEIIIKAIK